MNRLFHVHRRSQLLRLTLHLYLQNVKFSIACIGHKRIEVIFNITCKTGYTSSPFNALCHKHKNTIWAVFEIKDRNTWVIEKGLTQQKTLTNVYVGKDGCNLMSSTAMRVFKSQTSKPTHSRTRTHDAHGVVLPPSGQMKEELLHFTFSNHRSSRFTPEPAVA